MYLKFEKNGDLNWENASALGTQYGFFDRLRGMGTGFGKLIYLSGLDGFDELNELNNDAAYVNIEPTTKGFILRLNKSNRLAAFGIPFDQLKMMSLDQQYLASDNTKFALETADTTILFQVQSIQTRSFAKFLSSTAFTKVQSKISIKLA